jgi:hypothetical protein
LAVGDELLDRFLERRDVRTDNADLSGGSPGIHEIAGCFPRREVERLSDLLAGERAIHVNRTAAASISSGGIRGRT